MPDSPEAISLLDDEPKPLPPRGPDGKFVSPNPEPEVPSEVPPSSPHPTFLVQQAKEVLGLEDSEIAGTPTAVLYKAVHQAITKQFEAQNFVLRSQSLTNQPQSIPQPALPEDELGDVDWGKDDEGKPLGPQAFASPLVALHRKQAKEIKELRQALLAQQQREQYREIERGKSLIDDAFEGMGEKYAKIVGSGAGSELQAANDPAFQRRVALLNAAGVRFDQLPSAKRLQKQLEKAAEVLWPSDLAGRPAPAGDAVYQQAIAGAGPTETEWKNGAVPRPTQRKPPVEPPGEARAIKNLARKQAELARQQGGEDVEVLDTLLG